MKELKPRTFVCEAGEFKKKLGLPDSGEVTAAEVTAEGVVISMVGDGVV